MASVLSDSVRPQRRQPTRLRRPWDSPDKNTGVGCHFPFQYIKVKSESEVAQSYLTLSDPMDCSLPGSSVHGIFQARVLEWAASAFSRELNWMLLNGLSGVCWARKRGRDQAETTQTIEGIGTRAIRCYKDEQNISKFARSLSDYSLGD